MQNLKSDIFKCIILYWPPIITFTCKSMKFPQIWYFQMYCSLLTSNYHFSPLTSNYHFFFKCNVLYWPPNIISEIIKCNVRYWSPNITFTCKSMKSEILTSNYHLYNAKVNITLEIFRFYTFALACKSTCKFQISYFGTWKWYLEVSREHHTWNFQISYFCK